MPGPKKGRPVHRVSPLLAAMSVALRVRAPELEGAAAILHIRCNGPDANPFAPRRIRPLRTCHKLTVHEFEQAIDIVLFFGVANVRA